MPLSMKGYPVDTFACPICGFPLDFHFVENGFTRKQIELHVGCSKCCWQEYWGIYSPQVKEGNRVHLDHGNGETGKSDAA